MPNRLFVIGAIQGCSVALKTLIDAINPQPVSITLVGSTGAQLGKKSQHQKASH
jgi:hypothetical protein